MFRINSVGYFLNVPKYIYVFRYLQMYSFFVQHDAQMDYCGTRLATCSFDRTVKVFNVENDFHTHVATLKGCVCNTFQNLLYFSKRHENLFTLSYLFLFVQMNEAISFGQHGCINN